MRKRLKPHDRKQLILATAVSHAFNQGYNDITCREIAADIKMSRTLVFHYFPTMKGLRDEVMRHAVQNKNCRIIAQGLLDHHPIALAAPTNLRHAALSCLV